MALIVKDRVKETTTTTGTTDFALGGSSQGFQSFLTIGNGNTTYYAAVDQDNGAWEVGVGTYSSAGPTLTRDTVLESSNAGSKVVFAAGIKEVFCTYPAERSVYLDAAGFAVSILDIGTLGVSTANITTANITAGTVTTTPASGNDLVNKTYVDTLVSSGITYHAPVKYEVPAISLNATYNQPGGAGVGVGATLTNAGTLAAFAPDGPTAIIGDRILVYNQTSAFQNGVYTVTTVGSGSVAWVLTRATDADTYAIKSPNGLGEGDAFFITSGNTGAGETYVVNTVGVITFGTTNITFAQISSAQIYSAGTGLTLSGTQFSITPVGTAGTYGSASSVPVLAINASGQITTATPTPIAIAAAAVSGLATSATTDTTNAANITSGTLPVGRLNGSYTGVTGVGTLAAGTWNASTIGATFGGTGLTSFTQGDLLYADSTTTVGRLADVVSGNALISGGVAGDPAWGKIGLDTHVSGTLPIANGGSGTTTAQTAMNAFAGAVTSGSYLRGNGTNVVMSTIQAGDVPTLNQNTTGTASNVTGTVAVANGGTGLTSLGTGVTTFLGTPSSANLAAAVTDETGSGALVFATTPALTNPTVTNYTETQNTANTSTAITLNLADGTVQNLTLTGTATITMPTAAGGKSFILYLKTGAGSYSVTWTTVKWPGGTAPTITATASRMDIYSFFSDGTNWYGTTVGQNYTP
jgi:hypothetical protein